MTEVVGGGYSSNWLFPNFKLLAAERGRTPCTLEYVDSLECALG